MLNNLARDFLRTKKKNLSKKLHKKVPTLDIKVYAPVLHNHHHVLRREIVPHFGDILQNMQCFLEPQ